MSLPCPICRALFRVQRHKGNLMCIDFLLMVIRLSGGLYSLCEDLEPQTAVIETDSRLSTMTLDNNNHNPHNHHSSAACTQSSKVNKITQLTPAILFPHPRWLSELSRRGGPWAEVSYRGKTQKLRAKGVMFWSLFVKSPNLSLPAVPHRYSSNLTSGCGEMHHLCF